MTLHTHAFPSENPLDCGPPDLLLTTPKLSSIDSQPLTQISTDYFHNRFCYRSVKFMVFQS